MTILLLGATGYLGGNIAHRLTQEGHIVICVVRRTSDLSRLKSFSNDKLRLISNDTTQLELTLQQERIDWIINGVCTYKPNNSLYGDMLESNVIFPLNVLNLAIKYNVGNFMTMGTGLPKNFNVYSYTKSKLADFGKYFSDENGINFVELKLEMFYGGEGEPQSRFLNICRQSLAKGENLQLTKGLQKRDIVNVEDILNIILLLMNKNYVIGYRELPVGSGEQHSICDMVQFMKEIMHSRSILEFGAIQSRQGEPDTVADVSWYRDIGYELKFDFFDGLRNYCKAVN